MSQVDVPIIFVNVPFFIPDPTAPMCASNAPPATATRGTIVPIPVTLTAENGAPMPGRMGLEVEVRDAAGVPHDESGIYPVNEGQVTIDLRPALDDPAGAWTITCTDVAGTLHGTATVNVK